MLAVSDKVPPALTGLLLDAVGASGIGLTVTVTGGGAALPVHPLASVTVT